MIILADIGNTSITFGICPVRKNIKIFRMSTELIKNHSEFKRKFRIYAHSLGIKSSSVKAIVICSVVPQVTRKLKTLFASLFKNADIGVLGKDIPVKIKNKYSYPSQVGVDRLVNALGACYYYKPPVLVVDFGTAITIDVLSRGGEYLGGVIVPGIGMSLSSLHEKTALLPLIKGLKKPASVLGKNTRDSILSGIVYGYSFLVDGLIQKLKSTIKGRWTVVATGGNLNLMSKSCKKIDFFDESLTMKGIEIAYNLSKNLKKY